VTDEEIESYRKRLNELTANCSEKHPEPHIQEELRKLAREVGASTRGIYMTGTTEGSIRDADTSVLIRNIHQALQTASMVNMCRSAREGYNLAIEASNRAVKHFKWLTVIAILSTLIALGSAIASWIVAFRN